MKKLVKIKFRDKTHMTVTLEQAEAILNSQEQLVMLYNEEGEWTGQSINKSEIVGSDRDFYEEDREKNKDFPLLVGKPDLTPEQRKELFTKYHPNNIKLPYADN